MLKNKIIVLLCLTGCLILSGCQKEKEVAAPVTTVKTQKAVFEKPHESSVYPGSVKGRFENKLSFQVPGKILARYIDRGRQVHQGELLLEIDPKDIVEKVRMAKAQFDAVNAAFSLASSDFDRHEQLYQKNAVSKAQLDAFKAALDTAAGTLRQAQAQYSQSRNELNYTQLTAPSDGVISSVEVEAGQVVAPGQVVTTLVETKELEVEINIPERRISSLALGQKVAVNFWALPEAKAEGFIREISPMADPVTRTYQVRVQLAATVPGLQLGMTASVEINTDALNGSPIIKLPVSAILQTIDAPKVWVVEQNKLKLKAVTTAGFSGNDILVTAGLTEGEIVVVAGVHKLQEGQAVQLMNGEGNQP